MDGWADGWMDGLMSVLIVLYCIVSSFNILSTNRNSYGLMDG